MLKQSLIAAVFLLWSATATPTGNHTCTGVVKHEVTVRVNVTEPVTFRAYEWCLRVPPRCSTYTIQLKDRVKIHKEMHNRTITVCCKGYVEIDYTCVPACPPEAECPNMHCNRTNHCYCTPGYTGLYCNHPCPKGVWGAGCIKPCDCPPGYTCHHLTGDCMIDDSPPLKTRRTTTAEYLTEAATTSDTTTKISTTVRTTQPSTTPSTTTTTSTTTERPTTTTTTTTTERPTTTKTTERPTTTTRITTELATQPTARTTQLSTTTEQTVIPTTTTTETTTPPTFAPELTRTSTTTTTEKVTTTLPTSTAMPTIQNNFEDTTIPTTSTTTEALTIPQEWVTMLPTPILKQTSEATEATTATPTTTTTQKTTVKITSTSTPPPLPSTTIPVITEAPVTVQENTTEATNPTTTTTTTTTTPAPTTELTATEPTTEATPNTTPTTSTTQANVQTTLTTTQLPTTTTTETLATTQREIQTEPTIFVAPPIKFDQAAVTVQAPVTTEKTTETTQSPTTVTQSTTTTRPSTTTEPTTERQTQSELITSTTLKTETPLSGEVLKTSTTTNPQLEEKRLDGWGKNQFGFETKIDPKKSLQSVVKIGLTEKPKTTLTVDSGQESSGREEILEEPKAYDEKPLESEAEVLTSTTDRLDRLIIEDVPKPAPPKPTTDDSPIKLVEEVISKYFPDTFLKPNKSQASEKEKPQGKMKLEVSDKSVIAPWMAATKETDKPKTAETTEVLQTEEETKSHPRTDTTTTTIPPPTTPDFSTIPIITPKVIVSAKNPDEIDLGGVIYRKMKFFPPAKQPEETSQPAPKTTPSINLHSEHEATTGDRFKIYLPEYEKSTEKIDIETTEVPAVKTFLPKFNFDKEEFDYGKQTQPKKAKQKDKDKEVKKYKIKPNEATIPPTSAEEVDNDRVTNNIFLETKEFKVHLATTKAAKFGDGYYTKSDQESTDYGKFQKKKPKYGSDSEPTKLIKYTVPPESQDFEEGTREGSFPTTNAKPPHTWYSHAREKAKIKNAFKIMKSTIGLDLNVKPTDESTLEESNDIHSLATQFTEREPRSAAVTYQEDLNNPQMFGQVKFNAPEGFMSWMADDGVKSGIYASVAVGGGCFVAMATLVAVLWLRLKGRARPMESSASFEDGDVRNPVRIGQPGPSNTIGDYETVYPIASESDEMATFFCPTFTNNYAERINREFKEMSYDHPRPSIVEPLYAEILHPKIKEVDQFE